MAIRTRSVRTAGIRRCGVRHTAEPQIWPADQFTPDQIRILKADRDLVVEEVDAPEETDPARAPEPSLESKTVAELRDQVAALGIDLERIQGTGKGGAVVKADLIRVIREPPAAGPRAGAGREGPRLVVQEGAASDSEEKPQTAADAPTNTPEARALAAARGEGEADGEGSEA